MSKYQMDIAYLHIVLNHLPIIGVPFGIGMLLLGLLAKNDSIKRAALFSFVILGILTVPVYLTGQGGEDFVEDLAGVSEVAIEDHERMATFALISVGLLSLFSLFILLKYGGIFELFRGRRREESRLLDGEAQADSTRGPVPGWVVAATLIIALAAAGILGYTGKLGGKIRHTEFYGGAAAEEDEEEGGRNRRGRNRDAPANTAAANRPADEDEAEEADGEEREESGRNRRGPRRRGN